jgi:hypothetical protein
MTTSSTGTMTMDDGMSVTGTEEQKQRTKVWNVIEVFDRLQNNGKSALHAAPATQLTENSNFVACVFTQVMMKTSSGATNKQKFFSWQPKKSTFTHIQ